jgi:hypothetical protein
MPLAAHVHKAHIQCRDAYDALEVAVNRFLLESKARTFMQADAEVFPSLRALMEQLPTQTDRTVEQTEFSSSPLLLRLLSLPQSCWGYSHKISSSNHRRGPAASQSGRVRWACELSATKSAPAGVPCWKLSDLKRTTSTQRSFTTCCQTMSGQRSSDEPAFQRDRWPRCAASFQVRFAAS